MYKNKTFLAVIPARGGSKGIPKKNIRNVNGKPLISYTIQAALQSVYLDRIIVSTDDNQIAAVSEQYGAEVPFRRPAKLATDEAQTIDTVVHAIEQIEEKYDYVVLLQPTQPLRTTKQIDEAIRQIVDANETSLVSVERVTQHPILYRTIDQKGHLHPLINESSTVRRQDFKPYYMVNGLIYINRIDTLSSKTSLNDNRYAYITDPTIDIDTEEDLIKFENQLKRDSNNSYEC